MSDNQQPKVGVGVMIFKDGKILLSCRKGAHGEGEWSFPGGHLEYLESFEQCAIRETREESGIEIKNLRFGFLANVTKYAPKHYVHIGIIADWESGDPQVLSGEHSQPWGWYSLDNVPEPLFEFCKLSIESYLNGQQYYDGK